MAAYAHVCVCVHVCVYVCVYVHVYVCVYVHVYVCVHAQEQAVPIVLARLFEDLQHQDLEDEDLEHGTPL